jgi:hypothetical protein
LIWAGFGDWNVADGDFGTGGDYCFFHCGSGGSGGGAGLV